MKRDIEREAHALADEYQSGDWRTVFANFDEKGKRVRPDAIPMRDVPKHFDGGDIDDEQHWYGALMCCLECRNVDAMRMTVTRTYLLAALSCGSCGEVFAEVWR